MCERVVAVNRSFDGPVVTFGRTDGVVRLVEAVASLLVQASHTEHLHSPTDVLLDETLNS